MERQSLDTDTVDILDLDAVSADILLIQIIRFSRITGNDTGFRKEETAILIIDPVKRQNLKQIDIFADGIFLTQSFFTRNDYRRHREFIPAAVQFKKLFLYRSVFRHTHHQSMISPGTVNVGYNRIFITFHLLKQNSRFFIHISTGTSGSANIRFRIDLIFNADQLPLFF